MTIEPVRLEAGDAMELGELLGFIGEWLERDRHDLGASLRSYVGSDGYDVDELVNDARRFAILLGDGDSSALLGAEQP